MQFISSSVSGMPPSGMRDPQVGASVSFVYRMLASGFEGSASRPMQPVPGAPDTRSSTPGEVRSRPDAELSPLLWHEAPLHLSSKSLGTSQTRSSGSASSASSLAPSPVQPMNNNAIAHCPTTSGKNSPSEI